MSDSENIAHLTACPGCDECDALMEFYMACEFCGAWGHKDANGWGLHDGKPICYGCSNRLLGLADETPCRSAS